MCLGIPIDFVIFNLNRNLQGARFIQLLHQSVKTSPSALAKMVASFIKPDTIPRLFSLHFEEKKIDKFSNKLSFVSPEKGKREVMSEV